MNIDLQNAYNKWRDGKSINDGELRVLIKAHEQLVDLCDAMKYDYKLAFRIALYDLQELKRINCTREANRLQEWERISRAKNAISFNK